MNTGVNCFQTVVVTGQGICGKDADSGSGGIIDGGGEYIYGTDKDTD